jgi:cobalamin biosynthesis protein CobT
MARARFKNTRPATKPAAPTDPQREKAWRAVQKFNRMIPTLNSFARTLTGNKKLRVQAGKMTCTDKQVVYIRPPFSLGEELRHERMLCDERDNNRRPLCDACAQEDDIWKKLHHELAHHLGDSMARPTNEVITEMHNLVDEWHPKEACDHGYRMKLEMQYTDDYLALFGKFSPFLELLSQATEDARIDSMMLNLKPGLRDQFYSFTYRTFTEGFEQDNGEMLHWRDAPVNAQLTIGCLLIGSGYYIEPGWLSDGVIELLKDEQLRDIMSGAHNWDDVHIGALHTIYAFRRLHDMGYLQVAKCGVQEEPPSLGNPGDGGDGEESSEQDAGDDGDGDAGQQPEPGDESDDGPGDDADDPTGDGTAGDTASDGAFGDDFENEDDRSSGSDQEGGDDDAESDDSPVPGDDGDDSEDEGGSAGKPDTSDDDDADESGSDDSSGAGGQDETEDEDHSGEDDPEEGGQGGAGSSAPASDAGTDGDDAAQDGDGDGDGEPESDDEGSEPGAGDPEDEPLDEDDASLESDEGDDPVGAEVWDEEYDTPELKAARSIELPNPGDEHEVAEIMKNLHGHDDTDVQLAERAAHGHEVEEDDDAEDYMVAAIKAAIEVAINQAQFFDRASQEVGGVKEVTFPNVTYRWADYWGRDFKNLLPEESVLNPILQIGRRAFAENKRSHKARHLREGRVDGRVLGKRAALGDDRLFSKRIIPKRRDYIVGITLDCSGSNRSGNKMARAKRAVFAQAEMLHRLGIKFYITAHTGGLERWFIDGYSPARDNEMHELMLLWVKKIDEPWNDDTRKRLAAVQPSMENYDGHTLEYHYNLLRRQQVTDKIMIYYTDGAMPAANYDEEVVILEDHIQKCKKDNIGLLAVGINTNSPQQYGFDTVQVDSDEDLVKVMEQLERHLLK